MVPGLDTGSTIRMVLPGDEKATGVALFDRAVEFESVFSGADRGTG